MNPEPMSVPCVARAYGCLWSSALPLPLFQPAGISERNRNDSVVRVSLLEAEAPARAFSQAHGRQRLCPDGFRYLADDGAVIDVYGTDRMEIAPGSTWSGEPPAAFYGTATAALLAARGDLPVHGSCVEIQGRAVLLCGHSGAGKSTLTAALIAAGARLITDDLSAIGMAASGGEPVLFSGRRAIRLFPDVAGFLGDEVPVETVELPGERKVLAMPPTAAPDRAFPLAAVLILGAAGSIPLAETAGLELLEYSFRRRAFRHLPGFSRRLEIARRIAASLPVLTLPPVQARDREAFRAAAEGALRQLESAGITV